MTTTLEPGTTAAELTPSEVSLGGGSLLLIEDNPIDALRTMALIRSRVPDMSCRHVSTLADATPELLAAADCVLLDLTLPDAQDQEGLKEVLQRATDVPVVVLTGRDDPLTTGLESLRNGAQDFLTKGAIDAPALERAIRYAIERSGFQAQLAAAAVLSAANAVAAQTEATSTALVAASTQAGVQAAADAAAAAAATAIAAVDLSVASSAAADADAAAHAAVAGAAQVAAVAKAAADAAITAAGAAASAATASAALAGDATGTLAAEIKKQAAVTSTPATARTSDPAAAAMSDLAAAATSELAAAVTSDLAATADGDWAGRVLDRRELFIAIASALTGRGGAATGASAGLEARDLESQSAGLGNVGGQAVSRRAAGISVLILTVKLVVAVVILLAVILVITTGSAT
jgi:DNA-binding NarL/FixJ family response regulator